MTPPRFSSQKVAQQEREHAGSHWLTSMFSHKSSKANKVLKSQISGPGPLLSTDGNTVNIAAESGGVGGPAAAFAGKFNPRTYEAAKAARPPQRPKRPDQPTSMPKSKFHLNNFGRSQKESDDGQYIPARQDWEKKPRPIFGSNLPTVTPQVPIPKQSKSHFGHSQKESKGAQDGQYAPTPNEQREKEHKPMIPPRSRAVEAVTPKPSKSNFGQSHKEPKERHYMSPSQDKKENETRPPASMLRTDIGDDAIPKPSKSYWDHVHFGHSQKESKASHKRKSSDASFACQGIDQVREYQPSSPYDPSPSKDSHRPHDSVHDSSYGTGYQLPAKRYEPEHQYLPSPYALSPFSPGPFYLDSPSVLHPQPRHSYEESQDPYPRPMHVDGNRNTGSSNVQKYTEPADLYPEPLHIDRTSKTASSTANSDGAAGRREKRDTRFYKPYDDVLHEYQG